MNPNPVPEAAETKKFAESLAYLTRCLDQLPPNATSEQLQNTLRSVVAAFLMEGGLYARVLATHTNSLNELGQMLGNLSARRLIGGRMTMIIPRS